MNYEDAITEGGVDVTSQFKTPTYEDAVKQGGMDITSEYSKKRPSGAGRSFAPTLKDKFLKSIEEQYIAPAEVIGSLVTGAVEFPMARLGKLVDLARGKSEEEAEATEQRMSEKWTYQPVTESAQKVLEPIGAGINFVARTGREMAAMPAESWGLTGLKKEVALTAGELAAFGKLGKGIKMTKGMLSPKYIPDSVIEARALSKKVALDKALLEAEKTNNVQSGQQPFRGGLKTGKELFIDEPLEPNYGISPDVARFEGIQSVKERLPEVPDQMVWTDAKTGSSFQIPIMEGKELSSTIKANTDRIRAKFEEAPVSPQLGVVPEVAKPPLEPLIEEAKPQLGVTEIKQPWEMTRDDFVENYYKTDINIREIWKGKDFTETTAKIEVKKLGNEWKIEPSPYERNRFIVVKEKEQLPIEEYKKEYSDQLEIVHKQQIQKALSEGKLVPSEVLKDYSDLSKVSVEGRKALEPLAEEARKYGSAEEFRDAIQRISKRDGKLTNTEEKLRSQIVTTAGGKSTLLEEYNKQFGDFNKTYADFYNQAKAKQVTLEVGKPIDQFTTEYEGGQGERGSIEFGVKKETPKIVVPGTKDISLPEFGLTSLHVADRHPFIKPIIETNIKAEQNTNDWILRYGDRISEAFDKVEKPLLFRTVFGRKGTAIRDLDLMIEGKKPVPDKLSGFVADIKDILGNIKGEIVQKMKNDFAKSLSPKQREYLDWVEGGKVGDKPKYVRSGTINAVDEAFTQFKDMETWGIQDYFPHIFKGRYKYLDENGGIIASGQTARQAKVNFEEFVNSHPEVKDKTFMFVNDFYDLMTVRKILNPELTNPLQYLGSRLSRKEFFSLLNRTEKVIKEEITNAGIDNIPKVNIDMSGIASFQKGNKFSGHFLERKSSLRGEEADPFRALMSYVFSVGRKLGLEDAKIDSYAFADSLPLNMPNAKSYIKMQADNMAGRYNIIDRLFDETIGEKLGMKPFAVTRMTAKGVGLESKLKLGYAPIKVAINRIGGTFHTILKEGSKNYIAGKKLLIAKDPELMGRIEKEGHLAGMEQLFAGEQLLGVSEKQTSWWRPLGQYQKAEVKNRSEALATAYSAGLKKFNGDKDAAWIYAIDSARLTQGLYNTVAKPIIVRGPLLQSSYQFKQYLNNEIRFMSQLTPAQWAGYIPGMVALSGTRGAILTIKSIIGISIIGLGIDELAERLNREAPHLHRGVFGLIGVDVSAPASWQIPSSVKDWIGVLPRDLIETGEMIIKGLQNNEWTDEQINDYVRQIVPVGYNVFKGLQMLSEGVTKEGTKTIYKGGKGEGVINLVGAKSVGQSQASDSARYMNQQRQMILEKSKVLEDKLFRSKNGEVISNTFNQLVELKNIQTREELQDFIGGLKKSAMSRQLTEEARIFMTLPKGLKREILEQRKGE